MEKKFNLLILTVLLIASLTVFTAVNSEAKSTAKTMEIYSDKSDIFELEFVRVLENGIWYIYIYTDDGQFVAKFEEL
jgi:uncharacterized protein (UPF0333 family)